MMKTETDTSASCMTIESPHFVTIEGETWHASLTTSEYGQWDIYATAHPFLLGQSYGRTLEMFLAHLRRGVNLNLPIPKPVFACGDCDPCLGGRPDQCAML
jgi:hypothetical protein